MLHHSNMWTRVFTYFASLYLVLFYSCETADPRHYGQYKNKSHATLITLKEDGTFLYQRTKHMNSVNASGKYELKSDTLFFFYKDRNYDSIIVTESDQQVTLSQALGLPKILLWEKRKLFVTAGDDRVKYAQFSN